MSRPTHERDQALREAADEKARERKASAAARKRIRLALEPWADLHGEDSDAYRWIYSIAIETTPATAVALASMLDTLWRSYELEMMPENGGRPTLSFVEAANLRNRTLKELRPLLALIDPRDELPDLLRVVVAFKSEAERAGNRGPGLKVK